MTVQWHNEHSLIELCKEKYKHISLDCLSQTEYVRRLTRDIFLIFKLNWENSPATRCYTSLSLNNMPPNEYSSSLKF